MKLISVLLTLFIGIFVSTQAMAYVQRMPNDVKLPSQAVLEVQSFGAPIAALATRVLNAHAGPTSAAASTITTFAAQPDVARNLTITPGGTTADVEACVITVSGKNVQGKAISETFTFAADASAAVVGNKAFASVTSVTFPANCESGAFAATWSVGVGEKIGLKKCLANAGAWAWSTAAGAYESTRATVSANASLIESNTADFNGAMNGSNAFVGYYVQNFGCL